MTEEKKPQIAAETGGSKDRMWIPRFWNGMGIKAWWRLLVDNHFAIAPHRIPMAFISSGLACINTSLWTTQCLLFNHKIRKSSIEQDPIFIVGHWRSGTTMLHELMVLDDRHAYPSTYDCFAPNHFLCSAGFVTRCLWFLMPSKRPVDNMAAGWLRPQEDEFAMCNMGLPSPYATIAFPNRPPQNQEYLDFDGVAPEDVQRWKEALSWFLRCLTVREEKRIVLKSPTHTARMKALTELFPDARFVHIVRDPYVIFPSTVSLWKRLYRDQGFQSPRYDDLEEHVFQTFTKMYNAFERDRQHIKPSRLCEVRYEDLVKSPLEEMQRLYAKLDLGDFGRVRPTLEKHLADLSDYKTNKYEISHAIRDKITKRWAPYFKRYGYEKSPTT